MTPQIQEWVRVQKLKHIMYPGRVLEIGSLDINGGVRNYFTDATEYIGIDMQEGNGVDLVLNSHYIHQKFEWDSFDTVICLETLEHDIYYQTTLANIYYVLKPGGYFFLSTPTFGFPLHRYPKDYWRFGEDAYREVLMPPKEYEMLDLGFVYDSAASPGICAIARKLNDV